MATLRSTLASIDMTHPSITAGASAMLKHYDRSAETAVTEWRNALQSCTIPQLLPLLYVANEVLQNSKRNRGNAFLEAFSPTLGQALQHVCQRAPDLVEKVRRTAKIWGDRRVFSVRFVGELLKGLEPYRHGAVAPPTADEEPAPFEDEARFSPTQEDDGAQNDAHGDTLESPKPEDRTEVTASPTADDLMRPSSDDDSMNDDNDDDSLANFGGAVGQLDVTIDASQFTDDSGSSKIKRPSAVLAGGKRGRRRSTTAGNKTSKRRKSILSTQSLQDLWNQLSSLQQQYDQSQTMLKGMSAEHLNDTESSDDLIGDALLEAYATNQNYTHQIVKKERINLHKVAHGKRSLELEARRYLPWCRAALMQDTEDLELCNTIEKDLLQLSTIHARAQEVRNTRRELQQEAARQQQNAKQKQLDEEERKRLLEASLSKQEEAQPGMVWNRTAQEYQFLNTDESWRD
jgi:hypothetical protein